MAALRIASAVIARLSVGVSVVSSAFPALGASAAGSAVQRATEKPPTAASRTAPATPPRRRLSCVIIQHLRISSGLAAGGRASRRAARQRLRKAEWCRLSDPARRAGRVSGQVRRKRPEPAGVHEKQPVQAAGGRRSLREAGSLFQVHFARRRCLARQRGLSFRPRASPRDEFGQLGTAPCRARVCHSVEISGVAVYLKKKNNQPY